jgi:hypothetical protein
VFGESARCSQSTETGAKYYNFWHCHTGLDSLCLAGQD